MRALFYLMTGLPAGAMIFLNAEDPPANKQTAPTGAYENAGWQWEIRYKAFLGTMISPKHFITATHLGQGGTPDQPIFFNEQDDKVFTLANDGFRLGIPGTDLSVFEIWETFESYAPLYQGTDEADKEVFICGRGLGRGSVIMDGPDTIGWKWGNSATFADRWGVNLITDSRLSNGNDFLYTTFDPDGGIHECGLTANDSGGGWFIKENDTWKLAAVSSTVDSLRDTNDTIGDSSHFRATMSRARGFYLGSDSDGWIFIPDDPNDYTDPTEYYKNPSDARHYERTHSYGTRISSYLTELNALIQPAITHAALDGNDRFEAWLAENGVTSQNGLLDDPDGDGHPNLLEYFSNQNPTVRDLIPLNVERLAGGEIEFTLIESLDLKGRGLTGQIQKSSDLVNWTEVADLDEQSSTLNAAAGYRTRILQSVPESSGNQFYRIEITLAN